MTTAPSTAISTSFLFLSLVAVVIASISYPITARASTQTVDVAIFGAGLVGLSAAKDLTAANKSVLVIEARDRVGGRVLNARLLNGGVTEFVGPTQDQVLALVAELDLEIFAMHNLGDNVLWQNGTKSTYGTGGVNATVPPVDALSLSEVASALTSLDGMAAKINVTAPWAYPRAQEWDSITFSSWLDSVIALNPACFLLDVATTPIFSAEPQELSLPYVITYIAPAENETTAGTIEGLTGTGNGA